MSVMKSIFAALLLTTAFCTGCGENQQQTILTARMQEPAYVGVVTGKDYLPPQQTHVGHSIYKSTEEVYLLWVTGENRHGYEVVTRHEVLPDLFITYRIGDEIDITPAKSEE